MSFLGLLITPFWVSTPQGHDLLRLCNI